MSGPEGTSGPASTWPLHAPVEQSMETSLPPPQTSPALPRIVPAPLFSPKPEGRQEAHLESPLELSSIF